MLPPSFTLMSSAVPLPAELSSSLVSAWRWRLLRSLSAGAQNLATRYRVVYLLQRFLILKELDDRNDEENHGPHG